MGIWINVRISYINSIRNIGKHVFPFCKNWFDDIIGKITHPSNLKMAKKSWGISMFMTHSHCSMEISEWVMSIKIPHKFPMFFAIFVVECLIWPEIPSNQFVVIPPATIGSSRNRFYLWLVNKKPRLKKPVWQTEIFAGTKKSPANRHQPPIKATIVVSSLLGKKDVHNQPKRIGDFSFASFAICISTTTIWWRK